MAGTGWYTDGLRKVTIGTIDMDTSTLKVMLLKTSYTFDRDHTAVSSLTEITGVSGYTGGFAGAGRKTATVTTQSNNTDNRAEYAIADLTWTALAAGDTIGSAA